LEIIVLSQIWFASSSASSSSVLLDAIVAQQVRQIEVREPSGLRLWGKKGALLNVIKPLLMFVLSQRFVLLIRVMQVVGSMV